MSRSIAFLFALCVASSATTVHAQDRPNVLTLLDVALDDISIDKSAEDARGNVISLIVQGSGNGGTRNLALMSGSLRSAPLQSGTLVQEGTDNSIALSVLGDDNLFAVLQHGNGNIVDARVAGHGNSLAISQSGGGNLAMVSQTGRGNIVGITQSGW